MSPGVVGRPAGFLAPIGSEACTVPAHQGLRPYNLQSVQHPGSQAVEPNKQQPVDAPEGHSLRVVELQSEPTLNAFMAQAIAITHASGTLTRPSQILYLSLPQTQNS